MWKWYTLWYCCWDDEVGSYTINSSKQTVVQIKFIQEVVLPEVFQRNNSVIKEKITRFSSVFSNKKTSRKEIWIYQ